MGTSSDCNIIDRRDDAIRRQRANAKIDRRFNDFSISEILGVRSVISLLIAMGGRLFGRHEANERGHGGGCDENISAEDYASEIGVGIAVNGH
jgi:hypothetical protein